MPPNKPPNSSGNPVFVRSPTPTIVKPMATNNPMNGMMIHAGASSAPRLVEFRELLRRQHLLFFDDLDDARDAVADAAVVVVFPKARNELVADDLSREAIRQDAFEAVADFDAHFAFGRRHEHQHAVVLLGLPDAPLLEQADRIVLDRRCRQAMAR